MKHIICLSVVLLLIYACNTNQNKYPNATTNKIFAELKWGLNYSVVKNILLNNYKLEYSKQLESLNVYEFNGGKYNDMETKTWVVAFVNDSLASIQLRIASDRPENRDMLYKRLCELNDKELTKDSTSTIDEARWYYEKDGKRISNILISKSKYWPDHPKINEMAILISRGS